MRYHPPATDKNSLQSYVAVRLSQNGAYIRTVN